MHWPPVPGPGAKRWKPKGFVPAAASVSQTSIPARSSTSLSSLTSAMLTARKTFSNSLAASATSALETAWTSRSAAR